MEDAHREGPLSLKGEKATRAHISAAPTYPQKEKGYGGRRRDFSFGAHAMHFVIRAIEACFGQERYIRLIQLGRGEREKLKPSYKIRETQEPNC